MDTVALLGRVLLSLGLVLGLMWLVARRVRRTGGRPSALVDVLGRQTLTRNASVAVVRVLDQALILGVTDGQVSVLGEADLDAVTASLDEPKRARRAAHSQPTGATGRAARSAHSARSARGGAPRPVMTLVDGRPVRVDGGAAAAAHGSQEAPLADAVGAEARVPTPRRSPIAGSALSPQTWRQTVNTLRDLTSRTS